MSIWNYKQISHLLNPESHLSLGEGNTELEKYMIGSNKVLVKKEYQNPNKSFKDRSLAFQISKLHAQGINHAVISSTGNAAISALAYAEIAGIKLDIFVSAKIETKKIEYILTNKNKNFVLHRSATPKSDAIQFAKLHNIVNLRGSMDDDAVVGFKTISYELFDQNKDIDAIFIPCSSGTSTVGIFHGYQDIIKTDPSVKTPAIHICQTHKIHPMAKEFDKNFLRMYTSLAGSISDRVAKRKDEVMQVVRLTRGFGWVISDEELQTAQDLSMRAGIDFESYNSMLSLAGFLKSLTKGYRYNNPCLIYSGT